ncbi:MAG: hypothetical protein OEV61_02285 [Chloroflexota bacterium]|jgi:hypothetical protein|nr:hypothetical protein [Chloroflexota bacterium]MDH5243236.1 hypothetical protein [Chloroflexota bacterium]
MNHLYTIIALDIADERARQARLDQMAMRATMVSAKEPGVARRGLARALALVSRRSASAARHLDARTADDLRHALVPGE